MWWVVVSRLATLSLLLIPLPYTCQSIPNGTNMLVMDLDKLTILALRDAILHASSLVIIVCVAPLLGFLIVIAVR